MPPTTIPKSICILRLSALGDVTHMLPVINTLKAQWPQTRITWIIGKTEHKLMGNLPGIEFIRFDKSLGWRAYFDLKKQLARRQFEILLHMQVSLRANIAGLLVKAPIRIGYDKQRSKDLHGFFVNRRIEARNGQHVVESFFSFLTAIGIGEGLHRYHWQLPIPDGAYAFANQHIDKRKRTLIISPCSSHELRNWQAGDYAAVADYAVKRHHMQVILCGGPSKTEKEMGHSVVSSMQQPVLDLIGKDTLQEFMALLDKASLLLSPDAGPAHMATCVGTPVIGLYAASNPQRSGPYLSREWCVDRYPDAARQFFKADPKHIRWGTKIERPGVMALIKPQDVIKKMDAVLGINK